MNNKAVVFRLRHDLSWLLHEGEKENTRYFTSLRMAVNVFDSIVDCKTLVDFDDNERVILEEVTFVEINGEIFEKEVKTMIYI